MAPSRDAWLLCPAVCGDGSCGCRCARPIVLVFPPCIVVSVLYSTLYTLYTMHSVSSTLFSSLHTQHSILYTHYTLHYTLLSPLPTLHAAQGVWVAARRLTTGAA